MQSTVVSNRQFPLHAKHSEHQARFGAFGEWEVPLYYSSILEEHQAVRSAAGVFDISHMGEFFFSGNDVVTFLDRLLPRSVSAMQIGQALYMPLLRDNGTIVDDVILYRFEEKRFLLIVNAANVEKDFEWIQSQVNGDVQFENKSDAFGLLAVQGPKSEAIVAEALQDPSIKELGYYRFKPWQEGMIARTGYTGEDGFEIMVPNEKLTEVWDALFQNAEQTGLVPVGFGCRDTLRLEAGMLLYGHDMNDERNPIEAKISWAVDLNKEDFIGKAALVKVKEEGAKLKLIGFEMKERGIPREGYEILKNEQAIGAVTSGTLSPTLQKNIGLAYVPTEEAVEGNEIQIQVRNRSLNAVVVKTPFYKRKKG